MTSKQSSLTEKLSSLCSPLSQLIFLIFMSVWKCLVFFLVIKKVHPITLHHITIAQCVPRKKIYPFVFLFDFFPSTYMSLPSRNIKYCLRTLQDNGGEERRLSIITAVKSLTDLSVKSGNILARPLLDSNMSSFISRRK